MAESTQPAIAVAQQIEPQVDVAGRDAVVAVSAPAHAEALVEADLLVEDVSIDGMCGVY